MTKRVFKELSSAQLIAQYASSLLLLSAKWQFTSEISVLRLKSGGTFSDHKQDRETNLKRKQGLAIKPERQNACSVLHSVYSS